MYLWWSLRTLYSLACQLTVTVGDWGLLLWCPLLHLWRQSSRACVQQYHCPLFVEIHCVQSSLHSLTLLSPTLSQHYWHMQNKSSTHKLFCMNVRSSVQRLWLNGGMGGPRHRSDIQYLWCCAVVKRLPGKCSAIQHRIHRPNTINNIGIEINTLVPLWKIEILHDSRHRIE